MSTKAKYAAALLTLSVSGLAFITTQEGSRNAVYLDAVGIPTVCVGHTGPEVRLGQRYTDEVCRDLLAQDTRVAAQAVRDLVRVPVTQVQFDALVSFTFNLGRGNLASSTLLKRANAGDCLGAAKEILRWNRAQGEVLPGLTKRRIAESEMWKSGC